MQMYAQLHKLQNTERIMHYDKYGHWTQLQKKAILYDYI